MINQQLLGFIRQQLLKDLDKETITKELLGSGWNEKDINEGFNAVSAPVVSPIINPIINPATFNSINNPILAQTVNHSGKKIILIIVALFIIAGGVSGYYFRYDLPIIKDLIKPKHVEPIIQGEDTQNQIQKEEVTIPQQEQNQSSVKTNPAQESVPAIKTEDKKAIVSTPLKKEPINCGKDMTCFIDAAKTCSLSFVEYETSMSIFDTIEQTNKIKYSILGLDSQKKCIFNDYIEDETINLNSDTIALAMSKASSDQEKEEIKVALQNLKQSFDERSKEDIGMNIKCLFTTTYLTTLLTKWDNGSFSSSDMDPGNCDITGGTLPPPSTTIYISSSIKETSNAGLKFNYINVTKNSAKIIVTQSSTGKTQTVDFTLNKDMVVFDQTMTLVEVTEEEYMLNGEVFKYLDAGIEIIDK